jgi:hypothetical protein
MDGLGASELPGIPRAVRRFRLTAPVQAETDLHEATAKLLDRVISAAAMWVTYPAGAAQLSPQQQARYSRIGLKRGMPDVWLLSTKVYGIERSGHRTCRQPQGFTAPVEEGSLGHRRLSQDQHVAAVVDRVRPEMLQE